MNPNVEPPEVFSELVATIRQIGFVEPVLAWRRPDNMLQIVSGEHRWRAAKLIGYEEIPVVVLPFDNDADAHIYVVRMNAIRGKINPVRFTKLFNDLRKQMDPEALRKKMGLVDQKEFESLYQDVRATLPAQVQKRLDTHKKEIHTVDDLASIIQSTLAKYGSTLDHSFAVFEFGGKVHLVVRLTDRGFRNLQRIADECLDKNENINDVLTPLFESLQ